MNIEKAISFAKFVPEQVIRQCAKAGEFCEEAKAALEIQALCKKIKAKTGAWPNTDEVAKKHLASK